MKHESGKRKPGHPQFKQQKDREPHTKTCAQSTNATSSKLPIVLQKYENSVIGCKIVATGTD
jgi:hypothetical protein